MFLIINGVNIISYASIYIYIYINRCHPLKKNQYTTCTASFVVNVSLFWDVSVAQLVASASGVVLGGVAEVVGSNLARGKIFTASFGSVDFPPYLSTV